MSDSAGIANITPFSTLIVENAKSLPGGVSAANITQATSTIVSQLNFGLDTTSFQSDYVSRDRSKCSGHYQGK